jgi:hypothetical protein
MIWPTPSRGERIVLTCACHATVVWRLSLLFVYRILLVNKGNGCSRTRHASGRRLFVTLEGIAARTDVQGSA